MDINILDNLALLMNRMENIPIHDLEDYFLNVYLTAGITMGYITADHASNNPVFRNRIFVTIERFDGRPISKDGDRVGTSVVAFTKKPLLFKSSALAEIV